MADGGNGPSPAEMGLTQKDLGITPSTKKEVREFTRSSPEGQQARSETAGQILEARKNERSSGAESQNLKESVNQIMESLAGKKVNFFEARQQLDQLRIQYAERSARLFQRVFDFVSPSEKRAIETEIQAQNIQTIQSQQEIESLEQAASEFGKRLTTLDQDRATFKTGDQILSQFYQTHAEELVNFREAEARREQALQRCTIESAAKEYGAYFVHGINMNLGGQHEDNNIVLRSKTPWEVKLDILLGDQPTISASTLRPGHETVDQNTWPNAELGVILSGGRIEAAHRKDASTKARGLKTRLHFGDTEPEKIVENIGSAITERRELIPGKSQGYNEVVISDPEIAGLYIKSAFRHVPTEEVARIASELSLPVFMQTDGRFHEVRFVKDDILDEYLVPEIIDPDNPRGISPEEIVTRRVNLASEKKEELRKRSEAARTPQDVIDLILYYSKHPYQKPTEEELARVRAGRAPYKKTA